MTRRVVTRARDGYTRASDRGAFAVLASARLVTRRVRGDAAALWGIVALIAVTAALAIAVPAHIDSTIDHAARDAVSAAGSEADLLVRTSISDQWSSYPTSAEGVIDFARGVPDALPENLTSALQRISTGIIGPELEGPGPAGAVRVRVGVLEETAAEQLATVAGALPSPGSPSRTDALDVVVSAAAAEAAQITAGDILSVGTAGVQDAPVRLHIVGVVETADPSDQAWTDLPGVWDPRTVSSGSIRSGAAFTVLSDVAVFDRVAAAFPEDAEAIIRVSFDPADVDGQSVNTIRESIDGLETEPWTLDGGEAFGVSVTSGYERALETFPDAVRAATAQLSSLAAGLLGIATLVSVLSSIALSRRRRAQIELIRSRGASRGLVVAHSAIEALGVSAIGTALGVGAVTILGFSTRSVMLLVAAVSIVTLAPVLSTLRQVAPVPTSTRVVTVRSAGAAVLAAATITALIAVNGATEVDAAGIDPLALAAPLLCATVIALVLAPLPTVLLRSVSRVSARSRGTGALLAGSSARDGRSVLTLIALTLASSVAITSLVLVQTVASGQEAAAWSEVGADVRIDRATDPAALVQTFRDGGAEAAAVTVLTHTGVKGDSSSISATVLAVDADYARVLGALPEDQHRDGDAAAVADLHNGAGAGAGSPPDGPIPVLLDERLLALANGGSLSLDIDGTTVPVSAVNASAPLTGSASGPALVVDRGRLAAFLNAAAGSPPGETPEALDTSTVLAVGDSAAGTARTLDESTDAVAPVGSGGILVREDVLALQRDSAFVAGVAAATVQSLGGTSLLAVLVLVVTTVIGVRRRGRTLALLGALGVPRRAGLTLVLGELVPVVVSGVVGGCIAAAVVLATAGSAFGADILAGGEAPLVVAGWMPLTVAAVAAAALAIAVGVDLPLSRRVRTADILRTGEES
jgi:putative ABC transport system permease protein